MFAGPWIGLCDCGAPDPRRKYFTAICTDNPKRRQHSAAMYGEGPLPCCGLFHGVPHWVRALWAQCGNCFVNRRLRRILRRCRATNRMPLRPHNGAIAMAHIGVRPQFPGKVRAIYARLIMQKAAALGSLEFALILPFSQRPRL